MCYERLNLSHNIMVTLYRTGGAVKYLNVGQKVNLNDEYLPEVTMCDIQFSGSYLRTSEQVDNGHQDNGQRTP